MGPACYTGRMFESDGPPLCTFLGEDGRVHYGERGALVFLCGAPNTTPDRPFRTPGTVPQPGCDDCLNAGVDST